MDSGRCMVLGALGGVAGFVAAVAGMGAEAVVMVFAAGTVFGKGYAYYEQRERAAPPASE